MVKCLLRNLDSINDWLNKIGVYHIAKTTWEDLVPRRQVFKMMLTGPDGDRSRGWAWNWKPLKSKTSPYGSRQNLSRPCFIFIFIPKSFQKWKEKIEKNSFWLKIRLIFSKIQKIQIVKISLYLISVIKLDKILKNIFVNLPLGFEWMPSPYRHPQYYELHLAWLFHQLVTVSERPIGRPIKTSSQLMDIGNLPKLISIEALIFLSMR